MKKGKTKAKNSLVKKSKVLVKDATIESTIAAAYAGGQDDRPEKLVSHLILGCSFQEAAAKAGYAKGYARGPLYSNFKNGVRFRRVIESITSKMPERYRQICQLKLGQVAEIEQKALVEYQNDPKLAIDKPQLLKQIKQGARVLGDEEAANPFTYINLQVGVGQLYASEQRPQLTATFVDAEFEEATD